MKTRTYSPTTLLCTAMATMVIMGSSAQAGYIVTILQAGPSVVAFGHGAIDLTGLSLQHTETVSESIIVPNTGRILMGQTGLPKSIDVYSGPTFSGPASFGSGSGSFSNIGTGDFAGIIGATQMLLVPDLYVSGTPLSNTARWQGHNVPNGHVTFATLGIMPGTYEWTWGPGANQNFTLKIGAAAVADSGSTVTLFVLFFLALLAVTRLRLIRLI